jgi:hypothetical protein
VNHRFFARNELAAAALILLGTSLMVSKPADAQSRRPAKAVNSKNSVRTPRTADGHPDLNGRWTTGDVDFKKVGNTAYIVYVNRASRVKTAAKPPYKPELLAKVQELDENEVSVDPNFKCHPPGVPRLGPPQLIIQAPGTVALLYDYSDGLLFGNWTRVVPTDGRPHRKGLDSSTMGDSVGHWEGDTLVVDVTNFEDTTWIGIDGWFHSTAMHVIERFTRIGDTLSYQLTVEDPKVFTEPWTQDPKILKIDTDPADAYTEQPPCIEKDESHLVNHDHN